MSDYVYQELSYKLVGLAYKVFNELGYGLGEKHYQQAFATLLKKGKIPFEQEKLVKLSFQGTKIGTFFLDFVVDNKIVIETKVMHRLGYENIHQVIAYLKATGYRLAILIYFTKTGVKYRRVLKSTGRD